MHSSRLLTSRGQKQSNDCSTRSTMIYWRHSARACAYKQSSVYSPTYQLLHNSSHAPNSTHSSRHCCVDSCNSKRKDYRGKLITVSAIKHDAIRIRRMLYDNAASIPDAAAATTTTTATTATLSTSTEDQSEEASEKRSKRDEEDDDEKRRRSRRH